MYAAMAAGDLSVVAKIQAAIARSGGVPPLFHELSSEFHESRVYAARALSRWLSRTTAGCRSSRTADSRPSPACSSSSRPLSASLFSRHR
jgi:hypothetical protein